MRRFVPLALAALLTLSIAAPAAAGGKPEMSNNDPVVLGPDAFVGTCPFPVELVDSFASSRNLVFPPAEDGSQRLLAVGGFKSTITNLAPGGASLDLSFFGTGEFVFLPDGTVELAITGRSLWWFSDPVDAAMYGLEPGIYFITGRVTSLVDESLIALEPATVRGTVEDICAALA